MFHNQSVEHENPAKILTTLIFLHFLYLEFRFWDSNSTLSWDSLKVVNKIHRASTWVNIQINITPVKVLNFSFTWVKVQRYLIFNVLMYKSKNTDDEPYIYSSRLIQTRSLNQWVVDSKTVAIGPICEWIVQSYLWTNSTDSHERINSRSRIGHRSRVSEGVAISSFWNNEERYVFMECSGKKYDIMLCNVVK